MSGVGLELKGGGVTVAEVEAHLPSSVAGGSGASDLQIPQWRAGSSSHVYVSRTRADIRDKIPAAEVAEVMEGKKDATAAILATMEIEGTAHHGEAMYAKTTCVLPPGKYKAALGSVQRLDIEGAGPDATTLLCNSLTEPFVTAGGAGNTEDNYSRVARVSLEVPASRGYGHPFFLFQGGRNIILDTINTMGTDTETTVYTLFKFDSAYQIHARNMLLRTGILGAAFEWCAAYEPPAVGKVPQTDTIKWEKINVQGNNAFIARKPGNEAHGWEFNHFKTVGNASYSLGKYEGTLAAEAAAGATTITLEEAGHEAGNVVVASLKAKIEAAEAFPVGSLITLAPGTNNTEVVQVKSVAGLTITLTEPLRFTHKEEETHKVTVIEGSYSISMADGFRSVVFGPGCHFEHFPIGVALGTVYGVRMDAPLNGCSQLWRQCRETTNVWVDRPNMEGSTYANELTRIDPNYGGGGGGHSCTDPQEPSGTAHTAVYFPNSTQPYALTQNSSSTKPRITINASKGLYKNVAVESKLEGTQSSKITFGGAVIGAQLGMQRQKVTHAESPFTVKAEAVTGAQGYIGCTSTASGTTIKLPKLSEIEEGRIYVIKDEAGKAAEAGNNITVEGHEAAETIDGTATKTISTNFGVLRVMACGTVWFTI